jgi:hypothetical protein
MSDHQEPDEKFAGYSGNPLVKKLGVREGFLIAVVNPPDRYWDLMHPLPEGVTLAGPRAKSLDFIHIFAERSAELARAIPKAHDRIKADGAIWVSWPKKASGVPSDISEDEVRALALPRGLVDVKVCAVDETWSGLKLVIRKELRAQGGG